MDLSRAAAARRLRLAAAFLATITLAACASEPPSEPAPPAAPAVGDLPPHSPGVDPGGAAEAADRVFGTDSALLAPDPSAPTPAPAAPVIALLAPLSGQHAGAGEALLQGAQMALFDLGNPDAILLPLDTHGAPDGAARAMRQAIEAGAGLAIGPLLAGSVEAVRPIAAQAGINVVSFSNSPDAAGPPVYLAGYTPAAQVARILDAAIAEGRTRIAVLAPSGRYGDAVVAAAQSVFDGYRTGRRQPPPEIAAAIAAGRAAPVEPAAGAADALLGLGAARAAPPAPVALARLAYYDPGAADHGEVIRRLSDYDQRQRALERQRAELAARDDETAQAALKRLETLDTLGDPPFDAVLLPALDAQTLKILAAQLAFYDVDEPAVRLLGLQPWDGFATLSREPTLIGARYVATPDDLREQFAARFSAVYERAPSRLASLAYDVAAVAVSLAGTEERPSDFGAEALTNPIGFLGAEGLFRFTPDGLNERGFAVIEITPAGERIVERAPDRFPPPVSPLQEPPLGEEPPLEEPPLGSARPLPEAPPAS